MYDVIVKAETNTFLKYRNVSNLLTLASFLDINYKNWRYMNVYCKKTKQQLASFTKNNKPQKAKV